MAGGAIIRIVDGDLDDLWLEAYFFELPFDSGVPDNYVFHAKDDVGTPVEGGWADFPLGEFLGIRPEPSTGHMHSVTHMFRSGTVAMPSPIAAVEAAFPKDLTNGRGYRSWPRRVLYKTQLPRLFFDAKWGRPVTTHTVVKAVRIASPPASGVDEGRWRGDQITRCLRVLNEYLQALSGVRTNLAVGPVAAPDLPAVLFGYRIRLLAWLDGSQTEVERFAVVLHEHLPWATESLTWDQAEAAFTALGNSHQLFMQAMIWLRNAERSLGEENYRHAVIDACTAIEIAVSDVVRQGGPLVGYSSVKVSNVLDGPFASRLKDHFAVLLSFGRDPANSNDELAVWWSNGYLLRNRVVHLGLDPTASEAGQAVLAANALLDASIERARANESLQILLPPNVPGDQA